jgi:hypothetical protein
VVHSIQRPLRLRDDLHSDGASALPILMPALLQIPEIGRCHKNISGQPRVPSIPTNCIN